MSSASVLLHLLIASSVTVVTWYTPIVVAADVTRSLHYNITEQLPLASYVGDVKRDSGLVTRYNERDLVRMRFQFRQGTGSQQSRDLFIIDELSGEIRTNSVIDRDRMCAMMTSCDVAIEVTVRPVEYFQIIRVVVHIDDVNDNSPTFPRDHVSLSIVETTAAGSLFLLPAAEDLDSGVNGVAEYQLSSVDGIDISQLFELRVTSQVDGTKDVRLCLVGRLDRESVSAYRLLVRAVDGGQPVRSGSLSVHINVIDANDNSPVFGQLNYVVDIKEDLPPLTTIIQLHATDLDNGQNGHVTYRLADHTQSAFGHLFGVDRQTGKVFLRTSVDYELERTYQLTVEARDSAGPSSLSTFTKLTVRVHDVNDNSPVISVNSLTGHSDNSLQVREHIDLPGTFLSHIAVTDADSTQNGQVECQLTDQDGGDVSDHFRLESLADLSEYKLLTSTVFDREVRAKYVVTLSCHDRGVPSLSSNTDININIMDINDHTPKLWTELIEVSMAENNQLDIVIARINATDDDDGKNQALQYSMTSLDESTGGLLIDAVSGVITTNRSFDYETGPNELWYLVTVSDGGDISRTATTTLHVSITDTNDHLPIFDRHLYHVTVFENIPVGASVGRVVATDADVTSSFRRVRYAVVTSDGVQKEDSVFEVDVTSGVLRTVRPLDRESQATYRLLVTATDEQSLKLGASCQVIVTVEDVNDNKPMFTSVAAASSGSRPVDRLVVELCVSKPTELSYGTLVTRLVAVDEDQGQNAELVYSVSHGNEDSLFAIDAKTGVISVAAVGGLDIDRHLYRLVVSAADNGVPRLTTVIDLDIVINVTSSAVLTSELMTSGASVLDLLDTNTIILLCGLLAGVVIVISCIVAAALCLRRYSRKRREYLAVKRREPLGNGLPLDLQPDVVDSQLDSLGGAIDTRSSSLCFCKDATSSMVDNCSINSQARPRSHGVCRHHNCSDVIMSGPPDVTTCGGVGVSNGSATYVIDSCELQQFVESRGHLQQSAVCIEPTAYNLTPRAHLVTSPRPGGCYTCNCSDQSDLAVVHSPCQTVRRHQVGGAGCSGHHTGRRRSNGPARGYRVRQPSSLHTTSAASSCYSQSSSSAASSRAPSPAASSQRHHHIVSPDMFKVVGSDVSCRPLNHISGGRQMSIDVSESEIGSTDSGRGLSCQGHDDNNFKAFQAIVPALPVDAVTS